MRLDRDARSNHSLFIHPEHFSQAFDFVVHRLEHLPHAVYFYIATLVALHGVPNRDVLGQPQQHRFLRFLIRCGGLRCQSRECLAYGKAGPAGHHRKPGLKSLNVQLFAFRVAPTDLR